MSNKKNSKKANFNLAITGLVLILAADIVADLSLFAGEFNIIHWAEAGITAVSWILIIISLAGLRNKRKEFSIGFIASVAGLVFIMGECFFAYMNVRAGVVENVFVAMKPMFMEYISDLAMLLVFYMMVRGAGQLLTKNGNGELGSVSIKKSLVDPFTALIAMVLIPFGTVFSLPFSIIIGGIGIVLNAAVRLDMVLYIKNAADL